ncbi:MAG: LLM class flavin-dependent oxidoreductase [Beijerinckiaceae bacterium]|nr:LLM class flavin-dependent oxidoreductase [Beijerinckiaceae bacterium]
MEFGIFSNGFRPHSSAGQSYDEDIAEIVLADQLGFRDAYISEHHGEAPYIGRVDTIPTPDMLMCKAAALTKQIRMGSAVKLIHLHHPVDVAVQAAVTDHLIGNNRYIFGFGTGFASPLFSRERGLSFEDRHARLLESLDGVLKCWSNHEPFDLEGKYWNGQGIIALPKPIDAAAMPMATATDSEPMVKIAAERGYIQLSAFLESPQGIAAKAERYIRFANAAGVKSPRKNLTVSRLVYIAETREQAIEDMRAAVAYEVSVQAQRGFLNMLKKNFNLDVPNDERAIDALVECGMYIVGDVEQVTRQLREFYYATGGFGTLLIVAGKSWATREKRHRSMRTFMSEVAPRLRDLDADLGVAGAA